MYNIKTFLTVAVFIFEKKGSNQSKMISEEEYLGKFAWNQQRISIDLCYVFSF